ncbi:hypothetical protein [Mammaliicoccus sciuri]|uniref:hypothetical protein n=1 Tax=Mammaliicoccus sciuri TaxID=1296 RepID=UPI002B25A1F0|nr:hypothetical protein [Mammaliicoccus sciuri]WQK62779.1 hypothetical protein P3U20_11295 [Mammaliicoccus sciuri]
MLSWLLVISGLFLVITIFYYFKLISDSKNKIKSLNYYLNIHLEHLQNLKSGNIDNRIANKIIFKRVVIGKLINHPYTLTHENYLNPEMVNHQFFDINDAVEEEKIRLEKLINPKYAIQKTLSLPANFLNLIFPVKNIFKNLINFIFWLCTVLLPLIIKLLKLFQ